MQLKSAHFSSLNCWYTVYAPPDRCIGITDSIHFTPLNWHIYFAFSNHSNTDCSESLLSNNGINFESHNAEIACVLMVGIETFSAFTMQNPNFSMPQQTTDTMKNSGSLYVFWVDHNLHQCKPCCQFCYTCAQPFSGSPPCCVPCLPPALQSWKTQATLRLFFFFYEKVPHTYPAHDHHRY